VSLQANTQLQLAKQQLEVECQTAKQHLTEAQAAAAAATAAADAATDNLRGIVIQQCITGWQQQHDSRADASVTLSLVLQELQRSTPTPPLDPPETKVDKAELAKLCVHGLPHVVNADSRGRHSKEQALPGSKRPVSMAVGAGCAERQPSQLLDIPPALSVHSATLWHTPTTDS
jgi:hypothetical protein